VARSVYFARGLRPRGFFSLFMEVERNICNRKTLLGVKLGISFYRGKNEVVEIRTLRGIFRTVSKRKLNNEELHKSCSLSNIVEVLKSMSTRLAGM
jgi:hypothetical protein